MIYSFSKALPDIVGLAFFAATAATLVVAIVVEVRTRLSIPTHGDFSRLSEGR